MTRADSLTERLSTLQRSRELLAIAVNRNWQVAAEDLVGRLTHQVNDLPYLAGEFTQMAGRTEQSAPPTTREILAELEQLDTEFEQVKIEEKEKTLSVVTDHIELEDTYLGRFEIRLNLSRLFDLRRHHPYLIVALDPHPAASNDHVTHPHVSDEHLCEGDASAAIGAALAHGRLADFFMLVRSVLSQYNPGSPYVSLNDWSGYPCHDCGDSMSEGDSYFCSSCNNDFCDSCSSYCRRCDESNCRACLEECSVCGELVCSSCRLLCPECDALICKGCHEDAQCKCVQERQENKENSNDPRPQELVGAAAPEPQFAVTQSPADEPASSAAVAEAVPQARRRQTARVA